MFHAENDRREKGTQQSALSVQPLIHRKGREERKGKLVDTRAAIHSERKEHR